MPSLPTVLIIGDSTSLAYTPLVARRLEGFAEVVHHEGNGCDSANVLAHLDEWLAAADASMIHFNCGLHDLKLARDGSGHQVPLAAYRRNVGEIFRRLGATGKALQWATITPVLYERHLCKPFDRRQEDVDAYNAAAADAMKGLDIPVVDLHAVIQRAGVEACLGDDGVHMTPDASDLLAEAVAERIGDRMEELR